MLYFTTCQDAIPHLRSLYLPENGTHLWSDDGCNGKFAKKHFPTIRNFRFLSKARWEY